MRKIPTTIAAAAMLAQASYAWAATPEAFLGQPLPRLEGAAAPAPVVLPRATLPSRGALSKFSSALNGLQPEAPAATRGTNEVRVYQQASASVVLVVSEDSLGSGALISTDGQIITNLHVVGNADEVGVIFKPATEGTAPSEADIVVAQVVRRDEVADLALLRVAQVPAGIRPLVVGSISDVEIGSDVHAIGHPTGEAWTYTRGIVSQVRRDYEWAAEDRVPHKATVIQTQTPINPGNSGGPLISDDLRIVGINSFGGEGEGLNFAVSGDDVKTFLARTEDRMVAAADRPEACEPQATEPERHEEEPRGVSYLLDVDCDGRSDFIGITPDDKKEPLILMADRDGDGKIDITIYDDGQDGTMDEAYIDTDGNGEPDMRAAYRNGEDEPYLYEKISETD